MCSKTAVIISPEAVRRQLCGVILSRLMSRGNLTLEAAGLFRIDTRSAEKITRALPEAAGFESGDCCAAALICIFSGKNAAEKAAKILENIEFSFGKAFAAAPANSDQTADFMQIIADITNKDNLLTPAPQADEERTLLIIKPENFRQPSARPGAIIDMLMQLDLKWIGCKVHGMTINEALEFYAPVRQALRKKLGAKIGSKALEQIEKEFEFSFDRTAARQFTELAGNAYADDQFEQIVEFMAGKRPGEVAESERDLPAGAKCMVLIFDGKDAVAKIRKVLGPTNPAEASGGTVRYDFGTNIMVNAAHASDSVESYLRESAIVKVNENLLSKIAAEYK